MVRSSNIASWFCPAYKTRGIKSFSNQFPIVTAAKFYFFQYKIRWSDHLTQPIFVLGSRSLLCSPSGASPASRAGRSWGRSGTSRGRRGATARQPRPWQVCPPCRALEKGKEFHTQFEVYILTIKYASCIIYATQCQNFGFKLRRDHGKNSYECRAYESVDDGSLS